MERKRAAGMVTETKNMLQLCIGACVYACVPMRTCAGIKFTPEQQFKWVWATFLATFLDWVLYSTSKIVLEV